MPIFVLAGATATYTGKTKGWEHRYKKKCTVMRDTLASSSTYPVKFDGEDAIVHVQYENIDFLNKKVEELEYSQANKGELVEC